MTRYWYSILLIVCLCSTVDARDAAELANGGRYAEAAKAYLERVDQADGPAGKLKARLNAASCMKLSGDISTATRLLADSMSLLDRMSGDQARALFLSEYGSVLAMGKKPAQAIQVLERAFVIAIKLNDRALQAEIRNDLAIARAATGDLEGAYLDCEIAMQMAAAEGSLDLLSRARQNRLLTANAIWKRENEALLRTLATNPIVANDAALRESRTRLESCLLESNRQTMAKNGGPTLLFERISAGISAVRYGHEEQGFHMLESALDESRETGQLEMERAALLALAELYLDHGRRKDADLLLGHLRRIFPEESPVQQAGLEILLCRCEMLDGGNRQRARDHVKRAIRLIENQRGDIALTQSISDLGRLFRDWAGLPYLMLSDLETLDGSPAALGRAQQAIEDFKAWELDDFYRDDCVNLALENSTDLSKQIPDGVAVLYVIPLPDRTEILVGTSAGLRRWTSRIADVTLETKVRLFRYQLEFERGFPSYVSSSEFLFDLVISPCLDYLRKSDVRHLVFVPEGAFATIPIAALRNPDDGRYLIEEFSVSVSPGLSLLPNEVVESSPSGTLLAGVSDGVQGFAPLPGVGPELSKISKILETESILLNRDFTGESLSQRLSDSEPTTIHLASHAEFSSDSEDTFLLAYNGRITMNDLEEMIRPRKFTGHPVDILCLSACRTAAGNDRAALGLAGAAIKSGARSVLASLWYVDDAASSTLMVSFHQNRKKGKMGKAQALRKAQLDMIRSDPYIHPYLWAPFILIGDWK